jgi:tRNA (guanosine-2'-O-)-methyltransferase
MGYSPSVVRPECDATDRLIDRHGAERVVQALTPLLSEDRRQRIERVLDARLGGLTIVLENLYDPHNGAAAIRSIEGIGLTSLHVVEAREAFRFSPKVTVGCEKWLALYRFADLDSCVDRLRARGMALYAAVPGAAAQLADLVLAQPAALWFGNEHDGLSAAALAACDCAFAMPMRGFTRSFNLSVSVALCAYEAAERRRAAVGSAGDLGAAERAHLRARWYALGTRGADEVVARFVSS